jgi:hypothetical protein
VHQVCPLLRYVCILEGLSKGAQPLDSAVTRDARRSSLRDRVPCLAERLGARQVGVIAQTPGRVLQRELADLAIDPCPVDLDRLVVRRMRCLPMR